jgi:hypothetical protein
MPWQHLTTNVEIGENHQQLHLLREIKHHRSFPSSLLLLFRQHQLLDRQTYVINNMLKFVLLMTLRYHCILLLKSNDIYISVLIKGHCW